MPDDVATAALKALATRLGAWPGLTGVTIERERIAMVSDPPRIVIAAEAERIEEVFTGRADLDIGVLVECFHTGSSEAGARDAARALAAQVQAAILSDRTLGGAADDVEPGEISVDLAGGDPCEARADMMLTIVTASIWDDPFTRA